MGWIEWNTKSVLEWGVHRQQQPMGYLFDFFRDRVDGAVRSPKIATSRIPLCHC